MADILEQALDMARARFSRHAWECLTPQVQVSEVWREMRGLDARVAPASHRASERASVVPAASGQ
jgi:hypothetical protein